jgi:hypothetical protein
MPLTSHPVLVAAARASTPPLLRSRRRVLGLVLAAVLGAAAVFGLFSTRLAGVADADDVSSLPCGQNGGVPGPGSATTPGPLAKNLRLVARSTAVDGTVHAWGGAGQPITIGGPAANGAPEINGAELVPIDLDGDGTIDVKFGLGTRTSSAGTLSSGPSSIQSVLAQNFRLPATGPNGSVPLIGIDARATGVANASVKSDLIEFGLRFDFRVDGTYVGQELAIGIDGRSTATTAPRIPDDARVTLAGFGPAVGSDPKTTVIAIGQDVSWTGIAASNQPAIPLTYDLHRLDTTNPLGLDAKLRFGWQGRTPTETGFAIRNVCSPSNTSFRSTTHFAWSGTNLSGAGLGIDFGYGIGRGVAGGEAFGLHGSITAMSSRADAILHADGVSLSRSNDQPNMTITLDRLLSAPHEDTPAVPGTPERVMLVSGQLAKIPPHLVAGILNQGLEISGYDMACDLSTAPPADDLLPLFPGNCRRGGLVAVDTIAMDYRNYLPTDPAAAGLVASGIFEDGIAGHSSFIYEKTATNGGVATKSYTRLGVTLHGIKQVRATLLPHPAGEGAAQFEIHTTGAAVPFDVIVHHDERTTADRTIATGGTKLDLHSTLESLPTDVTLQARLANSESWSLTADTSSPMKLKGSLDLYAPGVPVLDAHGAIAIDGSVGATPLPTHFVLTRNRVDAAGVAEQSFTWSANSPTQLRLGATIGSPPPPSAPQPVIQPMPLPIAPVLAPNAYVPNPNAPKPRLRIFGSVTVPQDLTVAIRRVIDPNGQPGDVIAATATACNGVVEGCTDDVDVTADYSIPSVPDGDLVAGPPATPKHGADVAPAFADLGSNQGVNFVRLLPNVWGGRLHVKNVAMVQYSNSTNVTMPGAPATQICAKSNPVAEPFVAQLYASSPGFPSANVTYVNGVLSRVPSTVYLTMQPNVEQPGGSTLPTLPVDVVITDPSRPPIGPDTVSKTNGFFFGDTCYSLAPSSASAEATQPQGGTSINAVVRYGDENKMRQLGAVRRLNRVVPAQPPRWLPPIDTLPILTQAGVDPSATAGTPTADAAAPVVGGAETRTTTTAALDPAPPAARAVGLAPAVELTTVTVAPTAPNAVIKPIGTAPIDTVITNPLPPIVTDPLPPIVVDPVPPPPLPPCCILPPDGGIIIETVDGGPGIDVRGRIDGDGLAIDAHIVETVPRWFALYPVASRTCEPGQTCQWLESFEQEHRRKLDLKTRSSLGTLGELSIDLTVNQQAAANAAQYRILGRVENVPASLTGSLNLNRNDRLPWTDLDLSLNGKTPLKNVAVEVFDGSAPAHVGPSVGYVAPITSCTQVAGLCDRDPRPAPAGSQRAYPDAWGQTPTYRIGLANVTNKFTVHGVIRDSDKPTNDVGFTAPGSQPDNACANKPYRAMGQHTVYTHMDIDLKNAATRLDLTKHTGIDGSGTGEYQGTDLQPGSGSAATPYTPGKLPDSTGITLKSDAPIDAALRVRIDGIQVKAHEHRDFDVAGFDVASLDVRLCDDVDLPFEVGFRNVKNVRFAQSGAEFALDLTPADIAAGGWGQFKVHELLKTGDQVGAPTAFRENAVDMSWLADGPNGDLHDGPFYGGYKGVRLMPNAPRCHLPHYYFNTNTYQWVQNGSNLGMCYWPGAAEEPAGQMPGWNELNSTTLGIFTQQRANDVGGYKRLSFLADLLFSDSFLNQMYVRDAYGPVDPNGPGDNIMRAIAKQGVLPVDFRMPYVSSAVPVQENSSGPNSAAYAIGHDGTTYSWDGNSHLVARFPNGQIRWVRHYANPASSFQWRIQTFNDGTLWNTYKSPPWSPNPITIIHTYDASGTQTR